MDYLASSRSGRLPRSGGVRRGGCIRRLPATQAIVFPAENKSSYQVMKILAQFFSCGEGGGGLSNSLIATHDLRNATEKFTLP